MQTQYQISSCLLLTRLCVKVLALTPSVSSRMIPHHRLYSVRPIKCGASRPPSVPKRQKERDGKHAESEKGRRERVEKRGEMGGDKGNGREGKGTERGGWRQNNSEDVRALNVAAGVRFQPMRREITLSTEEGDTALLQL